MAVSGSTAVAVVVPSLRMPWPRHGREALTWPAFKACEPHVVLLVLTALALAGVGGSGCLALVLANRSGCMGGRGARAGSCSDRSLAGSAQG